MSYQQSNQQVHKLNEFVPNYVPHSDFLPNRVVDTNSNEAQQWVSFHLFRSPTTNSKNKLATSTLKSQWNSTQADTFLYVPMKMWLLINPFPRLNSTAESKEYDFIYHYLNLVSLYKQISVSQPYHNQDNCFLQFNKKLWNHDEEYRLLI